MLSYAVIGASRGIGLEYVRQLASRADTMVFAIARNPSGSIHLQTVAASFKNVHIIAGDVVDYPSLEVSQYPTGLGALMARPPKRAASQVSTITGGKLDYLIHNAAHMDMNAVLKGFDDYANMDELDEDFILAFKVNSLGPIHGIMAFLPLLRASDTKKIIVIGSINGDLNCVRTFELANMSAYGMSKAAATIAAAKFAIKLEDEGFVVVTLEPGAVNVSGTAAEHAYDGDMFKKLISTTKDQIERHLEVQTPQVSVKAQLKVIDGLGPSHNGLFISHKSGEFHAPI